MVCLHCVRLGDILLGETRLDFLIIGCVMVDGGHLRLSYFKLYYGNLDNVICDKLC